MAMQKDRRTDRNRRAPVAKSAGGREGSDTPPARAPKAAAPPRRRDRLRRPDSPRRSPMAASVPRPVKRTAGRTAVADTPAHIRAIGVPLDAADRAYLRRKLGRKLGKFGRRIERTSVRIEDVNGPRGGIDKRCRIKVVLSRLPSVVVEERDRVLQTAMDGALARAERAVKEAVHGPRMKFRRSRDYHTGSRKAATTDNEME